MDLILPKGVRPSMLPGLMALRTLATANEPAKTVILHFLPDGSCRAEGGDLDDVLEAIATLPGDQNMVPIMWLIANAVRRQMQDDMLSDAMDKAQDIEGQDLKSLRDDSFFSDEPAFDFSDTP